ncbi:MULTISPECIES: response regulator transcription factor [Lachnospiraceae]|jgi:two-component system, OmpR family, response regulator RegX3|uniref:Stage 0 sporulation protein A homolog n=1 Tax=Faecalicatena acetigenes TaxID=2981790 RepID=A0ABT2T920_9FIRM|nr:MULTISPECIES: response regulator transcription factor [Lachnospiraceae]MCU6746244.1 response regulator transcription factor [Faecalicatena acetigenes]RGT75139.1 DNA-binding response regulator [Ruminococcus sp. AF18-22]SCH03262.1 Sensory transduction protein regX3 [uncultured Clostridium sp.]
MTEILLIEDDKGLREGIAIGLGSKEYHFTGCTTLAQARETVRKKKKEYDLVILDLNLPDGSGYDFLKEYRQQTDGPVLILTANDLEMQEVMGFELGANDYVTKPFSLAILRARIANLIRNHTRREQAVYERSRYEDEHLYLDTRGWEFKKDGQEIILSRTEQKLLGILLENRGNTVPRERMLEKIWQDGAEYVEENALSVAVSRLRAKVEEDPSKPRHILNVYGIGYVWK